MTRNRLHLVIALAIGVVLLAGGFFLGVQPQLASAAANREQQRTIDATNDGYRTELARLAARSAELPAMQRKADDLATSIPSSADTASFYKEVDRVAASAGVTVDGITTSWAAAYTPPEAAAPAAGASGEPAEASGAATPSPTASASPSAPAAATPVTDAQITATNFSTIAISIGVTGSFEQALAFTSGMQNGDRLFLVNDIKSTREETTADGVTPPAGADTTSPGSTTWTLTGYIYVLSDAASAQASQGSDQGTGAPSDSATGTPTSSGTSTSAQG